MSYINEGPGNDDQRGLSLGLGAITSISGIAALVIFMAQNTADVTVTFFFWDFTWPLWLLTLVTAVFGAIVWFGLGVIRRRKRRKARRADRRD